MKRSIKVGMLLTAMAFILTGCGCYNKMAKNISEVQASATPELLTLKGQTVTADVNVTFPQKYFNKKAVLRITPVLVFEGGEIAATPKYVQGSKVRDNYTVISTPNGGSYTQTVTFPYDPRANISTLELRIEAQCNNGTFENIGTMTVAQGISTVQNYANWTGGMAPMADNFKRVTTVSETADLLFEVNSSRVRPVALRADQIKMLEDFVAENSTKDRTTLGSIYAKGYASPEGPVNFNDELSRARSKSGEEAMKKELTNVPAARFDVAAYGEDWEGFKKLVEQSNMPDKNLVLQVLNMYSSPVQRDQEIKNMSAVFEVLKKDILPQLRRTQFVASADISGKTDAELIAAATNDVNSLNLEEMLFAATLIDDNAQKARIYKAAADKFNDARAYNNYGMALAAQGDIEGAKRAIQRAASMSSTTEINNNLAAMALAEGNVQEAKKYASSLNNQTRSLIAIADGDYAAATRGLSGYNLALAEVLNGNLSRAKSALASETCAQSDYLRAVISMREGDSTGAVANLRTAISKDSSLRAKAKADAEFARLFGTPEFSAL